MTASKTSCSLLTRLRRTITRTLRKIRLASCTLTLNLGFLKIELKTEPKPEAPRRGRR